MALQVRARTQLIAQIKAHTVQRQYIAFVQGRAAKRNGTWRDWLQLSNDGWRQFIISADKRAVLANAQEAVTHYEVLDEFRLADGQSFVSKLRLQLETGLRHQIRIQAAHRGLPLVGDRTYNPNYQDSRPSSGLVPFARQALHAERLTLEHPDHPGQSMTWTTDLPKDLFRLERLLRSGNV